MRVGCFIGAGGMRFLQIFASAKMLDDSFGRNKIMEILVKLEKGSGLNKISMYTLVTD